MLDIKKFQFLIEKIGNNTIQLSQLTQNSSEISLGSLIDFDPTTTATKTEDEAAGAAKYIVVVVLVYGFAIIFFIGSQIRSTKKFSDDQQENNAEKIMRTMETEIFTKEVLGI